MTLTDSTSLKAPTISIVTATFNAAADLPRLVQSLKAQTDQKFEWVVADGLSSDHTMKILNEAKSNLDNVTVSSESDFGVYDALNRAITISKSEYYIILGADDFLYPDSIEKIKKEIINLNNPELISFSVMVDGNIFKKTRFDAIWLYAARAVISSHSVGLCIKKEIHNRFGLYSKKYFIFSDSHFLLKIFKNGIIPKYSNIVTGEFCSSGLSNSDKLQSYSEQMRALIEVGENPILQLMLFNIRFIKLIFKKIF